MKNVFVKDQVVLYRNSILIAFSNNDDVNHIKFFDPEISTKVQSSSFLPQFKPVNIIKCNYLNKSTRILISEKKGFFFVFLNSENPEVIHVPCNKENFINCSIRDVFFFQEPKEIAVVYDTPGGNGVTKCSLDERWNPVNCKTFNMENSGLLANDVEQIIKDQKDNIWFRYPRHLKKGVTRFSTDGNWNHYDHNNSELGHSSVSKILIEGKEKGLEGDNIWFVTDNGLTTLQYKNDKEVWKLYGKKRDSTDSFLRAFGMQYLSKKRVVDINGMVFVDDKIYLSNKKGLFQFDGISIKRYIPDGLGGGMMKEMWFLCFIGTIKSF